MGAQRVGKDGEPGRSQVREQHFHGCHRERLRPGSGQGRGEQACVFKRPETVRVLSKELKVWDPKCVLLKMGRAAESHEAWLVATAGASLLCFPLLLALSPNSCQGW